MSEESWNQARLIPTSGINGDQEQESVGNARTLVDSDARKVNGVRAA